MSDTVPTPRPAATLILVRDAGDGVEVLMLRRSPDAGFVAGMYVFPGGVLGPEDHDAGLAARAAAGGVDPGEVAHRLCAIRETFEEAGLLLARGRDGDYAVLDGEPQRAIAAHWRRRLHAGEASPLEMCRALALAPAIDALVPFSHWITPRGLPRRFDTRFYLAVAPPRQRAAHDGVETVDHRWIAPAAALAGHARGEFPIVHATATTLAALSRFAGTAALMADARSRGAPPARHPRLAADADGRRIIDPEHPAWAEIGRRDPDGRLGLSCELAPGPPADLGERLLRVTAPNGSFMTGPGTNTYLLGGGDELALIDPGPDDARHIDAVLAAAGSRRIRWILATHTHPDHSPAAAPLKAATGAMLIGMPPPLDGPQDRSFVPDRVPADGDSIEVAGLALRAVHTPGHASNHLCYLLADQRLLFTGDHVMQGSTVVIPPPDGDMAAYLASLARLLAEPLDWLAPGHGFLMDAPHARIEALIAHRLRREDKTLAALARLGETPLDQLVAAVYDDVPPRAHPVAARSLLAHLVKLGAEGRAAERDGRWRAVAR